VPNEPVADGRDTVENLLAKDAMRRRFAERAISLAGTKAYTALTRVFLFGNESLKQGGAIPGFLENICLCAVLHPSAPLTGAERAIRRAGKTPSTRTLFPGGFSFFLGEFP
jgi:hypothetical protein